MFSILWYFMQSFYIVLLRIRGLVLLLVFLGVMLGMLGRVNDWCIFLWGFLGFFWGWVFGWVRLGFFCGGRLVGCDDETFNETKFHNIYIYISMSIKIEQKSPNKSLLLNQTLHHHNKTLLINLPLKIRHIFLQHLLITLYRNIITKPISQFFSRNIPIFILIKTIES